MSTEAEEEGIHESFKSMTSTPDVVNLAKGWLADRFPITPKGIQSLCEEVLQRELELSRHKALLRRWMKRAAPIFDEDLKLDTERELGQGG